MTDKEAQETFDDYFALTRNKAFQTFEKHNPNAIKLKKSLKHLGAEVPDLAGAIKHCYKDSRAGTPVVGAFYFLLLGCTTIAYVDALLVLCQSVLLAYQRWHEPTAILFQIFRLARTTDYQQHAENNKYAVTLNKMLRNLMAENPKIKKIVTSCITLETTAQLRDNVAHLHQILLLHCQNEIIVDKLLSLCQKAGMTYLQNQQLRIHRQIKTQAVVFAAELERDKFDGKVRNILYDESNNELVILFNTDQVPDLWAWYDTFKKKVKELTSNVKEKHRFTRIIHVTVKYNSKLSISLNARNRSEHDLFFFDTVCDLLTRANFVSKKPRIRLSRATRGTTQADVMQFVTHSYDGSPLAWSTIKTSTLTAKFTSAQLPLIKEQLKRIGNIDEENILCKQLLDAPVIMIKVNVDDLTISIFGLQKPVTRRFHNESTCTSHATHFNASTPVPSSPQASHATNETLLKR